MAIENVRPTRLELLRTCRRIVVARRGLKLLKLKRTALIQEFFAISREARELRGDLQRKVARGYGSIRMAESARWSRPIAYEANSWSATPR